MQRAGRDPVGAPGSPSGGIPGHGDRLVAKEIEQKDDQSTGRWDESNRAPAALWVATICAAAVFFWGSQGSGYHPLATGLLFSSVSLALLLLLFECGWRVAIITLESSGAKVDR
jgi:hypothetical protein